MLYKVKAKIDKLKMKAFYTVLVDGSIANQEPDGTEIVNAIAKKAYVEKLNLLPVGSIILKPLYPDEQRSEIAKLTIMLKMEKGYDTQHGDWWYGVYDETGMEEYNQGKIQACIKCHAKAKETDYMFSEIMMESINEEEW